MVETIKTLFLYPKLGELSQDKQIEILDLIIQLKTIVNISNKKIAKILRDSSFSYTRCLPSVTIEELCSEIFKNENAERIRVCVIGYNESNYTEFYTDICNKYMQNKLNISHLVGIKINTNTETVKFYKNGDSQFDVIIETGLSDLENILVSIMLDISIYHYFALSNDIQYRRTFSELKMKGIKEAPYINEYGENIDLKTIKYLPFTYPFVKKIANNSEAISEVINDIVNNYFDFIKRYVCISVCLNKYKELETPYAYTDDIKDQLNLLIENSNFKKGNMYYVVNNNNDPQKSIIINDDSNAKITWLAKINSPLNNCTLYHIKIGE